MSTQRYTHSWITLSSICLALGAAVGACDTEALTEVELEAELPAPPPLEKLGVDLNDLLLERYTQRILDTAPTQMTGIVTSIDDSPIAGVKVTVGDLEGLTDAAGKYSIDGVEVGSYVVSFEHADHVFAQRRLVIEHPEPAWLPQRLLPRSQPQRINADALSVVREGPLTLEFEPGDLEFERDHRAVYGLIDVSITVIDPRVLGHLDAAPAELEGMTSDGQQVGLFSFGMLEVELSQNGKKVNVRRSETVKASMDVTDKFSLPPGDSIPMWHHDTATGIWAQERGLDAKVEERGGVRLATAELPHFSAWNYDTIADATCAPLSVPATMSVGKVRVTSTSQNGTPDGLWSITADCAAGSTFDSRCAINVPSGGASGVYFKLQAQNPGTQAWCDMSLELNGATKGVFSGADVNKFLADNALPAGSWCGSTKPVYGGNKFIEKEWAIALTLENLPSNRVPFGTPMSSLNCPTTVGANALVAIDKGYQAMANQAASPALKNDFDADGILDAVDKCPGKKNTSQADSDADGVGNICEKACYVAPTTPNAKFYDADADGIDDYCDNAWSKLNYSQQ